MKLLGRQKFLELELESENIVEAENQFKLLELKDDYNLDIENSLSDVNIHLFTQVKQRTTKLKVI